MTGFLGTNAPFSADLILVLSIVVIGLLALGTVLVMRKRYEAHRWCQTAAVAVNLVLVLVSMVGSYLSGIAPALPGGLSEPYVRSATIHATLGLITVMMGLFMVLRGNNLLPRALSFQNYKPWMRATLALYVISTGLGIWTYMTFYAG